MSFNKDKNWNIYVSKTSYEYRSIGLTLSKSRPSSWDHSGSYTHQRFEITLSLFWIRIYLWVKWRIWQCKEDGTYGRCILTKGHTGNHETAQGTRWGSEYEG